MAIKELLKRSYYALTSVAFFVILLNSWTTAFREVLNRNFFYLDIGVCGIILTLAVSAWCWALNRNHEKPIRKWWIGAIPVTLLLARFGCIQLLMALARNNQEYINIHMVNVIFFAVLALYTGIVAFCAKSICDYRNILPNQTKTDTHIFRWLFIVAHVAMWSCFILIFPTFYGDWVGWWPTESWVNETVNQMQQEFQDAGL